MNTQEPEPPVWVGPFLISGPTADDRFDLSHFNLTRGEVEILVMELQQRLLRTREANQTPGRDVP